MSLESRKGRWYVCYRPDGRYGKRVRVPIPVGQDPRRWHDDFIREWKEAKGQPAERTLTGLTVGQLWPEYLKWSELHHAKTTHRDLKNVGQWIKKYLGSFDAEGIGPHQISLYQRMRTADAGRTINRTVNKEIAYFCGMVKWAGRQGHITPRRMQIDRLPYVRPLPHVLTVGEVSALIAQCEPFYQAYLLCLYAMGLRSVEARNLRWKDVDFERGTVNLIQKGGSTKSLPMGAAVISSLKAIAPPRSKLKAGGGDLPVFRHPDPHYGTGEAVKNLRPAIQRACQKAGITKRVTPHIFRHSFATHLVDVNVNLRTIQKLLGHSRITTTEIYTHVSLENMRQAQGVIGKGLRGFGHISARHS